MNQQAFTFDLDEKMKYPDGFWKWLAENGNLYAHFSKTALRMAQVRPRYSARTIVEVMRWDTDLRDTSKTFKIQNNMVPGMARLWMHEHGRMYPNFFQLRDSLGYDEQFNSQGNR